MSKLKRFLVSICIVLVIASLVFLVARDGGRNNRELARRIAELSPRGGPPETIEGLRRAIALYEDQIEKNVREGAQTGVYWKILAIRLADRDMHYDALVALEKAIRFNAQDPVLYNLTGVSAGVVAKSIVGFSANAEKEREQYFKLAESSYLRAIELDSTYTKPMYGLGVLYVFELGRPGEAIPYLEQNLRLYSSDIPAMFVLARAYAMTGSFQQAIDLYDRIISRTRDQKTKEEALRNIEIIQRAIYG
jgi:tetratricopeptide (TPR) repeat protein